MSKVRPGDVLCCEVCGLALVVDEDCDCVVAELVCCDEPMTNKGPKPAKKVAAAPKKKPAAPKAKPAAKKPAAKKPAAGKPAAKKKAAKK